MMNAGPRNDSRSSSSPDPGPERQRRAAGRDPTLPMATVSLPAMIFFISFSAQAMASLVDVPVTALAIMLGRMNELVMSWTLSEAGAGQP